MKFILTTTQGVVVLASVLSGLSLAASEPAPTHVDANDISFLWPAPTTLEEAEGLIGADEVAADGSELWPSEAFLQVLTAARTVEVVTPSGTVNRISLDESFMRQNTWKVAGMRIDPSAPGANERLIREFGSTPQIRLVVQPVTPAGPGRVRVHDVAAHLVFDLSETGQSNTAHAIQAKTRFRTVLNELLAIKSLAEGAGTPTNGPLSVHPGFQQKVPGFAGSVRQFIKRNLSSGRLRAVAFMGLDPPEPWIFFAMTRKNGEFVRVFSPQMLTFRGFGNGAVIPVLPTSTFGPGVGISTAALFGPMAARQLDDQAATGATTDGVRSLRNRDIPDVIANPQISHFFNTDCISCHTETTRRDALGIAENGGAFRYELPAGISGVDRATLPDDRWNVRNFGWFLGAKPTVSQRTANEAAESADFINREYLRQDLQAGNDSESLTARPLTLVMSIRSEGDSVALKELLGRMQGLPHDQNPIRQAMVRLANVHFARFVFLDERKLAVITTYDGDFEAYIDAFINEIGDIFDQLLEHMEDAPPLPVRENREAFLDYVKRNDLQPVGPFYNAYPSLGVQDIQLLQRNE